MRLHVARLLVVAVLAACATPTPQPTAVPTQVPTATAVPATATPAPTAIPTVLPLAKFEAITAGEHVKRMARGVSFGNALEAPSEGAWGVRIEDGDMATIKQGGFSTVRLPIRWSAHAQSTAPYSVDPVFLKRVDDVVRMALAQRLNVVINMHHYVEMESDFEAHKPRFMAIWRQVSQHFKDFPAELLFEPYNEPNGTITYGRWNRAIVEVHGIIRETNPRRNVIFGSADFNSIRMLEDLELPKDPHLVATFHYYAPFKFTHQGADWVSGAAAWLGTKWEASSNERGNIDFDLDEVARWSKKNGGIPIWLGEFGAFGAADMTSRALWTSYIARESEKRGFAWSYWEFASGFGVQDRATRKWREPLLKALVP